MPSAACDDRISCIHYTITFANLSSNIPNSQAYGSFTGELYKICKSSTRLTDFKYEIKMLVIKLKNQNFKYND